MLSKTSLQSTHASELARDEEGEYPPASCRDPYLCSLDHILAELERIDLLVEAQVGRARQLHKDNEFQGLYISEREVDAMLAEPMGLPPWAATPPVGTEANVAAAITRLSALIEPRKQASLQLGIPLRLLTLGERFHLSEFELDVILLCLAAELDLRYEKLYAYLQDDVTKKRPSVDLALNLLSPSFSAKLVLRRRFSSSAPLVKFLLISVVDDPAIPRPCLLNRYLKLDERIVGYLLDDNDIDSRLSSIVSLVQPKHTLEDVILPDNERLELLVSAHSKQRHGLNLHFQGPYGSGKRSTAGAICHSLGLKLLVVDSSR